MLTVTLDANQWQTVMNILMNTNAPWATTHPIITEIDKQLREQTQPEPQQQHKGNGEDLPTRQ